MPADDLGDLILDMRDGGAWAESLMDCGDGAAAQGSQPPAADPMQTLLALSRRQQAQDLEQQAQAAPAVRAALAHPGQPARGALMHPGPAMVPVSGGRPLTCAEGLACGTNSQWPPAQQQPAGQLSFYGAPAGVPPGGAPQLPWFVSMPALVHPAPPPLNFYQPDDAAPLVPAQPQGEGHASASGSVGFSDGTTLRMRSSLDSGSGSTLPPISGRPRHSAAAMVPFCGMPLGGEFEESRDAPSDSSDVEDGGGDRMERQHSLAQVGARCCWVLAACMQLACWLHGQGCRMRAKRVRRSWRNQPTVRSAAQTYLPPSAASRRLCLMPACSCLVPACPSSAATTAPRQH